MITKITKSSVIKTLFKYRIFNLDDKTKKDDNTGWPYRK